MVFLWAFLGFLLGAALSFFPLLYRSIKGRSLPSKEVLLSKGIDVGTGFLLYLLVSFCTLLYPSVNVPNSAIYISLSSTALVLLSPSKFLLPLFRKERPSLLSPRFFSIVLLVLVVLLEGLAFNASSYQSYPSLEPVSFESALPLGPGGTISFDLPAGALNFVIETNNGMESNLLIDFNMADGSILEVTHFGTPYSPASWIVSIPEGAVKVFVEASTDGGRYPGESYLVSRVLFNQSVPLAFNTLRLFLLWGTGSLLILFGFALWKRLGRKEDALLTGKEVRHWSLLLGGGAFLLFFLLSLGLKDMFYEPYPFNDYFSGGMNNAYTYFNLFDALMHGEVSLPLVPSEELLALEDPWNPANRGGVPYYWDVAFYGGKYYSYYGIAPCLLMFPFYWLVGEVPNGDFMLILASILYIAFLSHAIGAFMEAYDVELPRGQGLLVLFLGIFGGMPLSLVIFNMDAWKYRLPFSYGLVGLFLALGFSFLAKTDGKRRMLHLGIAALGAVFVAGSRPDMLLFLLMLLPLYLGMLLKGEGSFWRRLVPFLPMAGILVLGASLLMAYNYVRFGSLLEFGSRYQLTIVDGRNLEVSPWSMLLGITRYSFTPMEPVEGLPWWKIVTLELTGDTHTYLNSMPGTISDPATWPLFLLPALFLRKGKRLFEGGAVSLGILSLFLVAGVGYSLGGTCGRYALLAIPFASFLGTGTLLLLMRDAREMDGKKAWRNFGHALLVLTPFLLLGALTFSVSMSVNGFDGVWGGEMWGYRFLLDGAISFKPF